MVETASSPNYAAYIGPDPVEGGFMFEVYDRNIGGKVGMSYAIPTWEEAYSEGIACFKKFAGPDA